MTYKVWDAFWIEKTGGLLALFAMPGYPDVKVCNRALDRNG